MNSRPNALISLSIALITLASISILYVFYSKFNDQFIPMSSLLIFYYLSFSVAALVNAYLVYNGEKVAFVLYPTTVITYCIAIYLNYSDYINLIPLSLNCLLMANMGLLLLKKESIQFYNKPNLRWWLNPKRSLFACPVKITFSDKEFQFTTFDISRTGAFLTSENLDKIHWPEVNQTIKLEINIDNITKSIEAQAVRLEQNPKGKYPTGFGVNFRQEFSSLGAIQVQ